ncbi:helix-turn-helix domain-containing protein [Heyndrickxia coagulans]|uniref:helix-turn-helix domain-containing protein n=1 Tax=Heyndrickxia coagulans TaxID=1398 RepID=UPI00041EA69D|nr:AraC family transcriptional regulator [Heyndrickxia coagulans]
MNYSFNLVQPFLYYKCGEFSADIPWKHKEMYHQGDYEIIICTKGPVYIQVGPVQYELNENDVLLVPPYIKMYGYKLSSQPVNFYWLHFFTKQKPSFVEDEALTSYLSGIASGSFVSSINDKVILPDFFHINEAGKILIFMNQVLDVANSYHYSEQENDYLTTAFLIELSHTYLTQLSVNRHFQNSRVSKIKEWIRANLSEELSVEDVARAFQIHPDYLTRLFKRNTHRTTLQFINELKIETAKMLLLRTNLTVSQIASHAYFIDEKNFMRRFKKMTGLTPTEYRNAYTHTHLNNPRIDPTIPLPKQLENRINITKKV